MGFGVSGKIADAGEFSLIEGFVSGISLPESVLLGPGDDAAVFNISGSAVVSTDAMAENVHFRTDWSSGEDVGHKLVAQNVADLEAMGATPAAIVITLSVPPTTEISWVNDFASGVKQECAKAKIALVGGDTTSAEKITVSATVIGNTDSILPVTRSGAKVGDQVAYCGRLGWAQAGLIVLGRGFRSPRAVVEAHRRPEVPYGQGRVAALAGAHAMMDVSDGLLADLGHIAERSSVIIDLETKAFDIPEQLVAVGAATGKDPIEFILSGGEDHALVATFAPDAVLPAGWVKIGSVVASAGESDAGERVLVNGQSWSGVTGWDHFKV